jgi:hypothetical protein
MREDSFVVLSVGAHCVQVWGVGKPSRLIGKGLGYPRIPSAINGTGQDVLSLRGNFLEVTFCARPPEQFEGEPGRHAAMINDVVDRVCVPH